MSVASKLLPKLVYWNTRLVVGTYTAVSLPFYTIAQRPWKQLRLARQKRVVVEKSLDGSTYWTRYGPPVTHPNGYHNHSTFKEIVQMMKSKEDLTVPKLAYRALFCEKVLYDDNGNPLLQDGKIMKKMHLDSNYKWLNLKQIFDKIENLTKGLSAFNVNPRDKVIIYSDTRLDWFVSALALLYMDAIIVTLYSNLGTEGLIHGMNQTEAKHLITSADLLPRLSSVIHKAPNVKKIFFMRHEFEKNSKLPDFPEGVELIPLDEVESLGKSATSKSALPESNPDDISLIMYTSGTTGIPKAVMLSYRQLKSSVRALTSNIFDLAHESQRHTYASFLPLAHIMGFSFELTLFISGVKIGYSTPFTLTDSGPAHPEGQVGDLKLLKPTTLICVPLILDRIVKEIYLKLSHRSEAAPLIFTYLMDYKEKWKRRGYDTPIINWLVCRKVQEQFGGNLEYVVSGGAPLSPETEKIVRSALNVKLMQGYGATETTGGVIGMSRYDTFAGRAGFPLEGTRIKLEDWVEGGYTKNDKPNPRGEIISGGGTIGQGYFKLEEESKEAFHVDAEGIRWFHTGDIGEIFPDGSVQIIDRKKDLAKLQNGEYISLGKIESVLKTVPIVDNVCVCVSFNSNDICALITPSGKQLNLLANQLGKSKLSHDELCSDEQIKQAIMADITNTCAKSGLHKKETPFDIYICSEEWLPNNNLLTAAFKIKRGNIVKHYRKQIDAMFSK